MAPIVPQVHSQNDDVESANPPMSPQKIKDLHFKKQMRRLTYVTVLVMFLIALIFVFSLTVMRIQNPTFRIRNIVIEHLVLKSDNVSSLDMKFSAEVSVKNPNFGYFKFDEGTIVFLHRGVEVGEVSVGEATDGARSTKKMDVAAEVAIEKSSSLQSDLKSTFFTLTGEGKLSGKVHLMKVIKVKKIAKMSCEIVINLANRVVDDIKCK